MEDVARSAAGGIRCALCETVCGCFHAHVYNYKVQEKEKTRRHDAHTAHEYTLVHLVAMCIPRKH